MQWTGVEAKKIKKVLLGILVSHMEPDIVMAIKGLFDFIYLASYHIHCDTTLAYMCNALHYFYCCKHSFIWLGV